MKIQPRVFTQEKQRTKKYKEQMVGRNGLWEAIRPHFDPVFLSFLIPDDTRQLILKYFSKILKKISITNFHYNMAQIIEI